MAEEKKDEAEKVAEEVEVKAEEKAETKAEKKPSEESAKKTQTEEDGEGVIRLHDLRPAPGSNRKRIRVGRGDASKGKTSGRGTKGTGARKNVHPRFEGGQMPLQMRLPKLRGFKNPNRVVFQVVNLDRIQKLFPEGGEVDVAALVEAGAVRKNQPVKVLGSGEVRAAFQLKVDAWSASAAKKIEAAGGSIASE